MDGLPITSFLQGITSDRIDAVWSEVEPLIEKALDRSSRNMTTFEIGRALRAQDMQLWVAFDHGRIIAACVTEVRTDKVLFIRALAGDSLSDWRGIGTKLMRDYAKAKGCDAVEFIGRPGWGRKLKDWTLSKVVMRLEV